MIVCSFLVSVEKVDLISNANPVSSHFVHFSKMKQKICLVTFSVEGEKKKLAKKMMRKKKEKRPKSNKRYVFFRVLSDTKCTFLK